MNLTAINKYPEYLKYIDQTKFKEYLTAYRLYQLLNTDFNYTFNFDFFKYDNNPVVSELKDLYSLEYFILNKNNFDIYYPSEYLYDTTKYIHNFIYTRNKLIEYRNNFGNKIYEIEYDDYLPDFQVTEYHTNVYNLSFDDFINISKIMKEYSKKNYYKLSKETYVCIYNRFDCNQKIFINIKKNIIIYAHTNSTSKDSINNIRILLSTISISNILKYHNLIINSSIEHNIDTLTNIYTDKKQLAEILTNYILENDLIIDENELLNYKLKYKKEQLKDTLNNIYNRKISELNKDLDQTIANYNSLLNEKYVLNNNLIIINNTFNNFNLKYNGDYIENIDFDCENEFLYIKITTKILPILFIDYDLLKINLKNKIYNVDGATKEAIEMVDGNKYYFAIYPTTIRLKIDLITNSYNLVFKPKGISYFKYALNNTKNLTYNGHAMWNDGSGCLGTFGIPLTDAINEYNINKVIALLIQYLQSISPNDYAGKKTIEYPTIIDLENKQIVFTQGEFKTIQLED